MECPKCKANIEQKANNYWSDVCDCDTDACFDVECDTCFAQVRVAAEVLLVVEGADVD